MDICYQLDMPWVFGILLLQAVTHPLISSSSLFVYPASCHHIDVMDWNTILVKTSQN